MRRNPDLIRRIAFAIEDLEPGKFLYELEGVNQHLFAFHIELMLDSILIQGKVTKYADGSDPNATVLRLTSRGCDFIDSARSDTLWNKAKDSVIAPTASWTFEILTEWLKAEIRNGLPTIRSIGN